MFWRCCEGGDVLIYRDESFAQEKIRHRGNSGDIRNRLFSVLDCSLCLKKI